MRVKVVEILDGPISKDKWIRVKATGHLFICDMVRDSYMWKRKNWRIFFDTKNNKAYYCHELENVRVEEIEG